MIPPYFFVVLFLKEHLYLVYPAKELASGQQGNDEKLKDISHPPSKPKKPLKGAGYKSLIPWFDWRTECQKMGYKITLGDIAAETGYALSTIKGYHQRYRFEANFDEHTN